MGIPSAAYLCGLADKMYLLQIVPEWAFLLLKKLLKVKNLKKLDESLLVPLAGVEPARYHYRMILSHVRLPIPPQRQAPFRQEQ